MFQIKWLWENMKGYRAVYVCALCMTVICQSMYIISPHFVSQIVDEFIYGEQAAANIASNQGRLIYLIAMMILFTLLRTTIQYNANIM